MSLVTLIKECRKFIYIRDHDVQVVKTLSAVLFQGTCVASPTVFRYYTSYYQRCLSLLFLCFFNDFPNNNLTCLQWQEPRIYCNWQP